MTLKNMHEKTGLLVSGRIYHDFGKKTVNVSSQEKLELKEVMVKL